MPGQPRGQRGHGPARVVAQEHAHAEARVDPAPTTSTMSARRIKAPLASEAKPPHTPRSSAHAVAHAIRLAPQMGRDERILVNLSGRGDKDVDYVAEKLGLTGEADEVVR
ncbi:hypothetical protein [Micrococcus luteus]|uniref:hypothetical protein n=1 Tax=Micrococcus luteus TaxID=1270 RepID=UPI003592FA13